jgi:broad specificity phosphatase PhoE
MRAVQTAQEIVEGRGLNIILNYGLEERNYGLFDNLTMQEIKEQYPKEHSQWMADWLGYTVPDGESAAQVHKRTGEAMEHILESCTDKTVALVTHLGAARHMIANLLNLRLEDTYRFALSNCRAAVITADGDNRILKALNI